MRKLKKLISATLAVSLMASMFTSVSYASEDAVETTVDIEILSEQEETECADEGADDESCLPYADVYGTSASVDTDYQPEETEIVDEDNVVEESEETDSDADTLSELDPETPPEEKDGGDVTVIVTIEKSGFSVTKTGVLVEYTGKGGNVKIPEKVGGVTVTEIGEGAFCNPNIANLTSITIPKTVKKIGKKAFRVCGTALGGSREIDGEPYFEYNTVARHLCKVKKLVIPDSVEVIEEEAFLGWCDLEEIVFGKGLKTIGKAAFSADYNNWYLGDSYWTEYTPNKLTSIILPDSLETIGDYAFRQLISLADVKFGKNLKTIGNYAFWGCSALKVIDLPDSVTEIGDYAFDKNSGIVSIKLPGSIKKLRGYMICSSYLKDLVIPDSVTEIETDAIYNCSALETVVLGSGLTRLNDDYFATGCSKLWKVTIPSSIEFIGNKALSKNAISYINYTGTTKQWKALIAKYPDSYIAQNCSNWYIWCDGSKQGWGPGRWPDENKYTLSLDGKRFHTFESAMKSIAASTEEHTIVVTKPIEAKSFDFPKKAKIAIVAEGEGCINTTATKLAPQSELILDCPIINTNGKYISVNAKGTFKASRGTFENITAERVELSNVVINGTLKTTAKLDLDGLSNGSDYDRLYGVIIKKSAASNRSIWFTDCPYIGTVNTKGKVVIHGTATRAVSITSSFYVKDLADPEWISDIENVTVDKDVKFAGALEIYQSRIFGTLDVKGQWAYINTSTVYGKINIKNELALEDTVVCNNAVSCGEIYNGYGSDLTCQSLTISKGIDMSPDRPYSITITLIDKNGDIVKLTAGDKKAVVVKSFKGTFVEGTLLLNPACGKGTLRLVKNKIMLV